MIFRGFSDFSHAGLVALCRHNPTEENLAALRRQVAANYDAVVVARPWGEGQLCLDWPNDSNDSACGNDRC